MLTVTALLLVVCGLGVLWVWLRRPRGPRPPVYPGALPIIGHAHILATLNEVQLWNVMKDVVSFCLKHGGVVTVRLGLHNLYLITDPDDCFTVSNVCLHKPYMYKFASVWLHDYGLVTSDPPSWNSSRKLLNPLFNQRILNRYINAFNEQGRILVDNLVEKVGQGKFRHESYLMAHTLQTACQTSLGLNPQEWNTIGTTYIHGVDELFKLFCTRLMTVWLHVPFIYNWSSLKKQCDNLVKTVVGITESVIAKKKNELRESKEAKVQKGEMTPIRNESGKFKTLLDLLVDKEEGLTANEIREHIDTMIVATYDTTATSMIHALTFIGTYPNVQERIYNELQNVFGDFDRDVEISDLSKLIYLEAVIKETMRVSPPVPAIARNANQDVKLKNYTIPAGGTYALILYGMNRHAVWGADADQFRPERWLEPGGVPDNPNAFGSFSLGRRNCIGKVYAMMSMKISCVHLLRRYRLTSDYTKVILKWDSFLKPLSGHEITVELR